MTAALRIIVWGPGEVGSAVIRAALKRNDMRIVGAKVFSAHKDGKDAGELAGVGSIGVKATTSTADILALAADCVIFTPSPTAAPQELDEDVIRLLESGKNVISTAGHHSPSLPGRFADQRASAARLLAACRKGGVSLHGTGLHPTFMIERLALTLARALTTVDHIRFVEACDFSQAPTGMWGGLDALGFGHEVDALPADSQVLQAKAAAGAGTIGNVAHSLYGAAAADVRIESGFTGKAAGKAFRSGKTAIRKGSTAALCLTQRGYIGDHHFFTGETCWYLGPDHACRGDNLPFGNFTTPLSYTLEIVGEPTRLESQIELELTEEVNPFTCVTTQAVLDAIVPVCAAAPGIVLNDARPRYQRDTRLDTKRTGNAR